MKYLIWQLVLSELGEGGWYEDYEDYEVYEVYQEPPHLLMIPSHLRSFIAPHQIGRSQGRDVEW